MSGQRPGQRLESDYPAHVAGGAMVFARVTDVMLFSVSLINVRFD